MALPFALFASGCANVVDVGELEAYGLLVLDYDIYDYAGYLPRGPYAVGARPKGMAAAYLDSDRRQNLVVSRDDGTVAVFGQDRTRRFDLRDIYEVGGSPSCVAIGDFNGDGLPDIAVGHDSSTSKYVALLWNEVDTDLAARLGPGRGQVRAATHDGRHQHSVPTRHGGLLGAAPAQRGGTGGVRLPAADGVGSHAAMNPRA